MSTPLPLFDLLTPFMLQGERVRGRVVRLGAVADTILARYDYPPMVARLLGELLLAAAMLSANLKEHGIFTLQVRGVGLVPLVVVDVVHGGQMRGFADVRPEARAALAALTEYSPRALVGEGAYVAITLDSGVGRERYQGIVALEGDSVADALTAYFTNSDNRPRQALAYGGYYDRANAKCGARCGYPRIMGFCPCGDAYGHP
jgi:molecular chaperone Hsp33